MLADALGCIECPGCGLPLAEEGGALRCESGHTYDIARQGYVNLLPGGASAGTADTAEMVAAREVFLGKGHYAAIAEAVATAATIALADGPAGCVAEVGAGTGYYLAAALDALPGRTGLALDISKAAAKRAARAHASVSAFVCDAWERLPLRDGSVALLLDVFAPRNAAEFDRALAPGGALVVVTPAPGHLAEIVGPLGLLGVDERKDERLEAAFEGRFVRVSAEEVTRTLTLTHEEIASLVAMGPSARHAASDMAERIAALEDPASVTLSVIVATFRRVSGG